MKFNKVLTWAVMSLALLFGSVFATASINVVDLTVQEDNGDYLLLVSLQNENTSNGVYDEVKFTIEGLGTFTTSTIKLDTTNVTVATYNLRDVTEKFNSLVKGETYRVTVETSHDSKTETFLFGSEKDTEGLDLILESTKVNSLDVNDVDTVEFMNGENLKIDLRLSALSTFDDARIMVFIDGYEHSTLLDSTDVFAVKNGKTYVKTLNIQLPSDMKTQKDYILRIVGANGLTGITYKELDLYINTDRHKVDVLDLIMTPSTGVEAGQNLIANVRVKNNGQKNQESVKVTIAIPELGMSESSYVSTLNADSTVTSDDMLLFVPESAEAGTYDVIVTLKYNEGYTTSTEKFSFNVLAAREASENNLLVSFNNNANFGADSTIEIVVANPNSESKPISLVPVDNAWSDVEVSPTLAMVQGGASTTFVVKVNPKNGAMGEKELALTVKEGANTVNEFTVNGFVEKSTDAGQQIDWLNVALVVLLIVAIVVLLSLVVSIAKRRNDRDDDDLSSNEEYY